MLTPNDMFGYQKEATLHGLYHPDSMLWLGLGLGKEQPCSEPVLTPRGWEAIGSLSVGDEVIGSNGKPTKVTGVFPQGEKEVVQVTMGDGSWTRCGWSHLWAVRTPKDRARGKPWRVKTVAQMKMEGLRVWNNRKWEVPMPSPVQHSEKKLPMDPYTLGVILGDGCASRWNCTVCTDVEICEKVGADILRKHESSEYTCYAVVRGSKKVLEEMGLLGKRSWEKFVPEIYLRGSVEQRLKLLQGLMDTDGSPITAGGGTEFSSTSEALVDAVTELFESLGGVARKKGPRITYSQNGTKCVSWRVNGKLPSHKEPFTLKRKLEKWIRPTKYHASRRIDSIEPTGYSEESVCIKVAARDELYITRRHILTHNTAVALTIAVDRMRAGQVRGVLVFGPLRVVQSVWRAEARKWTHLQHLRFSLIHGNKAQRRRALFANADVFLVNYENVSWLARELDHYYTSRGEPLPWNMAIYDEVTKLKNSTSVRMNGGKRDIIDPRTKKEITVKKIGWRKFVDCFDYRIGLTGTPASNGYHDLHGQFLAVDGGMRLGSHKTPFENNYFTQNRNGWGFSVTGVGRSLIEAKISDITLKMDTKDYRTDMPDVVYKDIRVDLPPKALRTYKDMEKQMFAELEEGKHVEVFSAGAAAIKTLQIANGNIYTTERDPTLPEDSPQLIDGREWARVHDAKLEALDEVVEEAGGNPVLVAYAFKSDAARIMQKFKALKPVNLTAEPANQTENVVQRWKDGEIRLLLAHPASAGHGIDGLQDAGNIVVWFGLTYSLELYDQLNARIDRTGQKRPVSIIRILANKTLDLAVLAALKAKATDEASLKAAIEAYARGEDPEKAVITFV